MRLSLLPDGSLSFTQIHALEAGALLAIPQNADPTDVPEAEERLFPPPLEEAAQEPLDWEEQSAMQSDWQEFVVPELRELFDSSLDRVQENLRQLSPAPVETHQPPQPPDAPAPNFALIIPGELAEDWYRAMNQARLVMAQKTLWIDGQGDLHGPLISQIHYEIYTSIQQWLIEHVLSDA